MKAHRLPQAVSLGFVGTLMGLAALFAQGQAARAENVCTQTNPVELSDVTGATWQGTITDLTRYPYSGGHRLDVTMHIRAVVTGTGIAAGESVIVVSGPCNVFAGLHVGEQYLVSTAGIATILSRGPVSSDNVAFWSVSGDRATYVVMHPSPKQKVLEALRGATTVEQVIALVAPGGQLPPTDLARPPAPASDSLPVLSVGTCLGLLAALLFMRRRNRDHVAVG